MIDVLKVRFQSIPPELVDQIEALTSLEQLKGLLRQAVIAGTVEEFEQALDVDDSHPAE
ncbi:MAG TPA: hypothetical protein PKE45_04760 [Caldilineaceae bacterium]|nr:hypothetical protein [Caldilineaceae bacterium]